MKRMINRIVLGFLESLPLTLFLVYIHSVKIIERSDWVTPYLLSSVTAFFISGYLYKRSVVLNRLFLGIHLYFISGLFGLLIHWDWLNHWYGETRAAGMIYWIILVGVISGVFSRQGFLGVSEYKSHSAGFFSALLLFVCFVALALATYFSHSILLGEWMPFIFLFSLRALLLKFSRMP